MTSFLRSTLIAVAALSFCLVLPACDSGSDEPVTPPVVPVDPGPSAPVFSVSSESFTTSDGVQGITFEAVSNARVTLSQVTITNPRGEGFTVNTNNQQLVANERLELQDPGFGYPRVSGNWRFQFEGARSPAVTNGNFDVTTTVGVGAAVPNNPDN